MKKLQLCYLSLRTLTSLGQTIEAQAQKHTPAPSALTNRDCLARTQSELFKTLISCSPIPWKKKRQRISNPQTATFSIPFAKPQYASSAIFVCDYGRFILLSLSPSSPPFHPLFSPQFPRPARHRHQEYFSYPFPVSMSICFFSFHFYLSYELLMFVAVGGFLLCDRGHFVWEEGLIFAIGMLIHSSGCLSFCLPELGF